MSESRENTGTERRELLENLGEVTEVALEKYQKTRASNRDRMGWGRLVVSACEASAKILKDNDIDSLKREVEMIQRMMKKYGEDQKSH